MKKSLEYFYKIYPENIINKDENYYFIYNGKYYMFVPFDRPLTDQKLVYEVTMYLRKNVPVFNFVFNKHNEMVSFVGNKQYVLLTSEVDPNRKFSFGDLIMFQKYALYNKKNELFRHNWVTLWSEKIDYFEYQLNQMGKKYTLVYNSFAYFIGLGENAISYIKNTEIDYKMTQNDNFIISHKRLGCDSSYMELYNPITFIIDHFLRDVTEYLKSAVLNKKNALSILEQYLQSTRLSQYGYHILFGRLMFPSFYFDYFEEIIEGTMNEKEIVPVLDMIPEYEKFLADAFDLISKYNPIQSVEWLEKKSYNEL